MKRTTWAAVGLTALLSLACVPVLWPPGNGAVGQGAVGKGARQPAKWEYGELLAHQYGAEATVTWTSPAGKVGAAGWKGLLKKLAGREGAGEVVEALNVLGEQGWELVAVSERPIQGAGRVAGEAVTRWTFKRPK
jgi:hypothetical protein